MRAAELSNISSPSSIRSEGLSNPIGASEPDATSDQDSGRRKEGALPSLAFSSWPIVSVLQPARQILAFFIGHRLDQVSKD